MNEEELQSEIEKAKHFETSDPDASAYKQVFTALDKLPVYDLPRNFADKLVAQVHKKTESNSVIPTYMWFGVGIIILLASFAYTIYISNIKFEMGFLENLLDHKPFIVFSIGFISLLNWIDKRLVRSKDNETVIR